MPTTMTETIIIERRFQGVSGQGQGGHTAGLLAERIEGTSVADFFSPIPLDTPLRVREHGRRLELIDGENLILRVRASDTDLPLSEPASVAEAAAAQRRSPVRRHPVVPDCYSCGTVDGTMQVHAGKLEGRAEFATTWTPPAWTADLHGNVLPRHVWAAIDCPSGWCAGTLEDGSFRLAVTGSMAARLFTPVPSGETHVIVAWADDWKGRRVRAGSALFDRHGRRLAASTSTWIALRT